MLKAALIKQISCVTGSAGGPMTLRVTRRQFFKLGAAGMATSSLAMMGFAPDSAVASVRHFKLAAAKITRSNCTYCSVGCGVLLYSRGDGAINSVDNIYHVEGDPDHPVSRGSYAPKGRGYSTTYKVSRGCATPKCVSPAVMSGSASAGTKHLIASPAT